MVNVWLLFTYTHGTVYAYAYLADRCLHALHVWQAQFLCKDSVYFLESATHPNLDTDLYAISTEQVCLIRTQNQFWYQVQLKNENTAYTH